MSEPRPVYCGDRVRFHLEAAVALEGVVLVVETWRDCLEGMREAEAKEFTELVERCLAAHGGRSQWARVAVRASTGRSYLVEAPQFEVVESRAAVQEARPKQLKAEEVDGTNDTAKAAERG